MQATVTTPKLYELADEFTVLAGRHLALVEEIEEAGGECSDEQFEALHNLETELGRILGESDSKIVTIMRMCEQRNMEIVAIKAEELRLAELATEIGRRRKRLEKSNEWFEKYCADNMLRMGANQVSDGINTVKLRQSERTDVENIASLDRQYVSRVTIDRPAETGVWLETLALLEARKFSIDFQPDKTAIKKALKAGETVEGARITEHHTVKFS